ncbi:MAG: hypothetical protein C5B57_10900 [Blastocatellia bacterium]|nr:MAG: hypothetical protein C5B57_10900 [Blastocatellia bacterium]
MGAAGAMRPSMKSLSCRLSAFVVILAAGSVVSASENPQRTFAKDWEGSAVVLKQTLYTLVYNERGLLGNTHDARREGLMVVTAYGDVFLQFDGRQGRDDIAARDPQRILDLVSVTYQQDSVEVRSYRRLEPLLISRYSPGVELVVSEVRFKIDSVRFSFSETSGSHLVADPITSITVKWPSHFSKSFSERNVVEELIRRFVVVKAGS